MTMTDKRTAFIGFYLTDREKARVQDNAEEDNRTVSDYVRKVVIDACDAPQPISEEEYKELLRRAKAQTCGN